MTRKKYFFRTSFLILALSFLVLMVSTHATAVQKDVPKKKQANVEYYFVQSATKAKIEVDKKDNNTFTLTLKDVVPYVTYFSERPQRDAGAMPMAEFIKLWERNSKNSFRSDPPNANLHGMEVLSSDKGLNFIFELKDPQYNARAKTLTYTARSITRDATVLPTTTLLKHVILFIDGVCLGCW